MCESRWVGAVLAVDLSTAPFARKNDESDGRIPGENGVEDMGSIISSIAHER
jgi:hypothetical protein